MRKLKIGNTIMVEEMAKELHITNKFTRKPPFIVPMTAEEIVRTHEWKQFRKRCPTIAETIEYGYAFKKVTFHKGKQGG